MMTTDNVERLRSMHRSTPTIGEHRGLTGELGLTR